MNKKKILNEIKELLVEYLPGKIDRIILFGSQVSGNSEPYSDYDVLVIVKEECAWREEDKILDLCYDIDLKYDILTDVKVISVEELNSIIGKQPFILDAFKNGITV